ncbi:MAG: patatin-like phospholipase family protein [Bacteroidales bacterium]|nr:patatin-like phospholipase family protein [Bacteroidales bacterium]
MLKDVALVLSSGGARGIAHIGVIEELEQSGYRITSIAGTSMGSVIGGMYALGKLEEYKQWLLQVTKMDIIKFLDLTIGHGGLVKGEKIVQVMHGFIGEALIENLPMPYTAVAVDIKRHKEVHFRSGSLMKAIRASISIPTVFLPVSYDHSSLVDGGVLNPLPLDAIVRIPNDLLVAVNVNAPISVASEPELSISKVHEQGYQNAREHLNKRWSELINRGRRTSVIKPKEMGLFDLVSESINLMQHKIALHSIEKYSPDILINLPFKIATVYDFYRAETLIEAGRKACREALKGI